MLVIRIMSMINSVYVIKSLLQRVSPTGCGVVLGGMRGCQNSLKALVNSKLTLNLSDGHKEFIITQYNYEITGEIV